MLLDSLDEQGEGPRYGYWGVSMGTAIGLPFVAAEPRVERRAPRAGGAGESARGRPTSNRLRADSRSP